MKTQHKKNLIELALHLLKNERDGYIKHGKLKVKFDMSNWVQVHGNGCSLNKIKLVVKNECATACCALGDWALLHPRRINDDMFWNEFMNQEFGCELYSRTYYLLFGEDNKNEVKDFARRSIKFLTKEDCSLDTKKSLTSKLTSLRNGLD